MLHAVLTVRYIYFFSAISFFHLFIRRFRIFRIFCCSSWWRLASIANFFPSLSLTHTNVLSFYLADLLLADLPAAHAQRIALLIPISHYIADCMILRISALSSEPNRTFAALKCSYSVRARLSWWCSFGAFYRTKFCMIQNTANGGGVT